MRPGTTALFAATVSSLVGCSAYDTATMYEGARLPADAECRLLADGPRPPASTQAPFQSPQRIFFDSFDKKNFHNEWQGRSTMTEIFMKPGRHQVKIRYQAGVNSGSMEFEFDAVAGHNYVAKGHITGYQFEVWIEDAQDGTRQGTRLR